MLINKSKAFPRCFLFARDILAPAFLGVRSEFVAIFSRLSHASLSLRSLCSLFARDALSVKTTLFLLVRSWFVLKVRSQFAQLPQRLLMLVQSVVNKNNRDFLVLNLQLTDIFSDELLQLQQVV